MIKNSKRIRLGITRCTIHDICRRVMAQFQANIILEGPDIEGYWCPKNLHRAIHNLLDNAIKYGDTSQPITIKVDQSHGSMRLQVHNKGEPIPFAAQETMFQPFHRSHVSNGDAIQGWGFGLPIVRGIIEAHGGSMDVESLPSRGTTFSFSIPLDARLYQNALTLE